MTNNRIDENIVNELIAKYSRDFSTDVHGQLSVVEILRESVAELVSMIPEIAVLSEDRKNQIEEQIVLFSLAIHDEAGDDNDRITESQHEADMDRLDNYK
jgi:hypothetical protein